jgi:hypothetical protein
MLIFKITSARPVDTLARSEREFSSSLDPDARAYRERQQRQNEFDRRRELEDQTAPRASQNLALAEAGRQAEFGDGRCGF